MMATSSSAGVQLLMFMVLMSTAGRGRVGELELYNSTPTPILFLSYHLSFLMSKTYNAYSRIPHL